MKKKIYNKKKFYSGIIFLVLALISILGIILRFDTLTVSRMIKYIVIGVLCILFGFTEIYRSLSITCTKEDNKNDDEREKLIDIKSKSRAFNITLFMCTVIIILSMIGIAVTKSDVWIGICICMSVMFVIMMIAEISSHFYYEKRN